MNTGVLASRKTSAFPLSIGTSLAMESVSQSGGTPYDPERVIPQHVDLKNYEQFWFNLSTLFRNMFSSVETENVKSLNINDCSQALLAEMELLESIISGETDGKIIPVFYISSYKGINSLSSRANMRTFTTPKQIHYYGLHDKTIQNVVNIRHQQGIDPKVFKGKINPDGYPNAIILTHVAYDLTAYNKFGHLDLLESNTGVLKSRNLWYTKYYQSEGLSRIPFTEQLLKFFGDNTLFRPFPINARRTIVELAEKRRWTWATTQAKIDMDISSLNDKLLADVIKSL